MAADHDIELADDGLVLRPFRLDDAEEICAAVRASLSELVVWLSWVHPQYTIEDTQAFLEGRAEAHTRDGEFAFAMIERQTGRVLGACGINQIEKAARRANLGYWLRTDATGQGYATRATRLVARWACESLGLERIEIVAAVGNKPSQAVAERAGASREGIARKRLNVHGEQHDAVVFSLVRGDFSQLLTPSTHGSADGRTA
jgi:RimJ/RimL family protein N-acetyltransferase